MRCRCTLPLLLLLVGLVAGQAPQTPMRPVAGTLRVGDLAPTFQLADLDGKNAVDLAKLRDKPVVLIFGSCT